MEDLRHDMPTPESSIFIENNNNADEPEVKEFDHTGTGIVNYDPDALKEPTQEEFDDNNLQLQHSAGSVDISRIDENVHLGSRTNLENKGNFLMPGEVSLPKVKALRIKDSSVMSVTADSPTNLESPNKLNNIDSSRVVVDTAAPIESVKDAVSKFGGIVDWKTHKLQTIERCKFIDQELDKTQEEMVECRKKAQTAEDSTYELFAEMDRVNKQINELESRLSLLRQENSNPDNQVVLGEFDDVDAAAEQDLKAILAEHKAALIELISFKEELGAEKAVVQLTDELVAAKQSLTAAQADYREAEDQRNALIVASKEDTLSWEREMKQIEAAVDRLTLEYSSVNDLKSQLDYASALLESLKTELESKTMQQKNETDNFKIQIGLVKLEIDKAVRKTCFFKEAATSLQTELKNEQNELTAMKERKQFAAAAVQSLEVELSMLKSDTAFAERKKNEATEKLEDLKSKWQEATEEAAHVKLQKLEVQRELRLAMDKAEQANAELTTSKAKLQAAMTETVATMASEELVLSAISSMQETETVLTTGDTESANVVSISSEEYLSLSHSSQEAENKAKTRLTAAFIELEETKKSESTSLQKLKEASQELSVMKEAYATATNKFTRASGDKLRLEQELRSLRTKNEQRRKANESAFVTTESAVLHPVLSPRSLKQRKDARKSGKVVATEPIREVPCQTPAVSVDRNNIDYNSSSDLKIVRRKKRSFFPRLLMFFGKRKAHAA